MNTYGQNFGLCVNGEQIALCLSAEMATTMNIVQEINIHLSGQRT